MARNDPHCKGVASSMSETSTNPAAAKTPTAVKTTVQIDIWSDIVCPWCYVGEARLRKAAASIDVPTEMVVRAYELDPTHSHPEKVLDMLARKYGTSAQQAEEMDERVATLARAEGLPYESDRLSANSFDSHRLIAAAAVEDLGLDVREAIQRGHFDGTVDISNHEQLADAAASAGFDRTRALAVLQSEEFTDEVRADQAQAREIGVTGVPFVVIGGRLAIPGAVDTTQYAEIIERVAAE